MKKYTKIPKRFGTWREARQIAGPILQEKRRYQAQLSSGGWFMIRFYKKDGPQTWVVATLDPSLVVPYYGTTGRKRAETINCSMWAKDSQSGSSHNRPLPGWRSFIVENLISIDPE